MLNLNNALNNAIAIVVVILILSLVVQSVQSVVKKLFKIKSRQIEESLVDLLRNVLNKPRPQLSWFGKLIDHSPVARILCFWREDKAKRAKVETIYNDIMDGFKDIGRLAQSGNQMLDSIAKEDLLKVLEKVPVSSVLPTFGKGVAAAFTSIGNLETNIRDLRAFALSGAASAQFASITAEYASIEVALSPLFNDVKAITNSHKLTEFGVPSETPLQEGEAAPPLLVRDIMALREIKVDEVLKLLGKVQNEVKVAAAAATAGTAAEAALTGLATGLGKIASDITDLRHLLDAAMAPFQAKVTEVERWYDTIMQSFEERYNRSMKSWAIVIAFLVVLVLNANFFNIYRGIVSNPAVTSLLVEKGPEILKVYSERTAPAETKPANAGAAEKKELTPEEKKAETEEAQKELRKGWQQVVNDANLYTSIGFQPLNWQEVRHWLSGLPPAGTEDKRWSEWSDRRKHDVSVLLGWMIMTMLLSIGAPFWQDTLESLFGVKNLLRKKGDIKNVEKESGAGQPKT